MDNVIQKDIREICNENIDWEKLNGKKILITGARGYIATYLVYAFLMLNDQYNLQMTIYAMCRDEKKSREYYADECKRNDFYLLVQDVCDYIDDKLSFDIVIHAASIANIYAQHINPYKTISANIIGLNNVISYCERHDCEKLLFFSSYMVYSLLSYERKTESSTICNLDFGDYRNAYAFSKQMGELMIASKKQEGFNTKAMIVRPMNIYGPGQHYSEKKPMTDFLADYIRGQNIILKSEGLQKRSYLYLTDAIRGIFYILIYGNDGEAYNLASEKNVCQIRNLAEEIASFDSNLKVEYAQKEENYFRKGSEIMLADVSKLKALGWKEEIDLKKGLSRVIKWIENDNDFFEV